MQITLLRTIAVFGIIKEYIYVLHISKILL